MTAAERDAITLINHLRAAHPHLELWTGSRGTGRTWFARGKDGHPWLIASDDLDRFRAALAATTQPHDP